MKKMLLTALFIIAIVNAYAQYTVLKVKGGVKRSDGVLLARGMRLGPDEAVIWSSLNDKIFAIEAGVGDKVIQPRPELKPVKSLLKELLSATLRAELKESDYSNRGLSEVVPASLAPDPGPDVPMVMQDTNKYLLTSLVYRDLDISSFYLKITLPDKSTVKRVLKVTNDTLIINANDFLTADTLGKLFVLYYDNPHAIARDDPQSYFTIYYDRDNEMDDIIKLSVDEFTQMGLERNFIADRVYGTVYLLLGKPNALLFNALFNKYCKV